MFMPATQFVLLLVIVIGATELSVDYRLDYEYEHRCAEHEHETPREEPGS